MGKFKDAKWHPLVAAVNMKARQLCPLLRLHARSKRTGKDGHRVKTCQTLSPLHASNPLSLSLRSLFPVSTQTASLSKPNANEVCTSTTLEWDPTLINSTNEGNFHLNTHTKTPDAVNFTAGTVAHLKRAGPAGRYWTTKQNQPRLRHLETESRIWEDYKKLSKLSHGLIMSMMQFGAQPPNKQSPSRTDLCKKALRAGYYN